MALTDVAVKKAKPTGKAYKLFDSGGLFLLVAPSGGRLWRWKFRHAGKEKLLSLGTYPEVSLADARVKQAEARKLLHEGVDPAAHKQARKVSLFDSATNSLKAIGEEWLAKFASTWAPAHAKGVRLRLENDAYPWLGNRPISEITPPEVLAVLRRVESRGRLETAHRLRISLGQIFRYAISTGRAERDPTADLRGALAPIKVRHRSAVTEPAKLADLLRVIRKYDEGTPIVAAALKLAPLLFVRPGELRSARWADIDLDAGEWRFVASKTGTPHIVPLPSQAVAILRELQPLTGRGPFVFPSARTNARCMSDAAINAALRRMGIDSAVATGHGFRATARTLLDEVLGFRVDWIEAQLAHAVRDPNGRAYNRTAFLPERKRMMQAWADYQDKLAADVKVIPFKRAAE